MQRILLFLTIAAFGPLALAAGSGADPGGGGLEGSMGPRVVKTPEQVAASEYKAGLRHKKKAWKQEGKAQTAKTDKKRDKALARAQKEYTKAIGNYATALQAVPRYAEAANELGYALRKTGQYKKAIGAYNYALEIKPDFNEAIEYRGEAFLALGLVDEAKKAYMQLFRADRDLAGQLMDAMDMWLVGQTNTEGTASFSSWVSERKHLAEVTQDLSLNNKREW
jgi:tetratricopeptide (TPR) repeat protein